MEKSKSSKYYTVNEFATEHTVCRATVYNWINSKIIQARKVGGKTLIPIDQEIGILIEA